MSLCEILQEAASALFTRRREIKAVNEKRRSAVFSGTIYGRSEEIRKLTAEWATEEFGQEITPRFVDECRREYSSWTKMKALEMDHIARDKKNNAKKANVDSLAAYLKNNQV